MHSDMFARDFTMFDVDSCMCSSFFSAPPVAKRGGPGGLSKICGDSPELQAIVGEPAMPRTQVFF